VSVRRRDPRPPRRLRRDGDGELYELDEHRVISLSELAEDVRSGRRFRAYQHGSERDCTQQVLLAVLGAAAPGGRLSSPGSSGAGLAGAVGAVAAVIADRRADEAAGASSDHAGRRARRSRPRLEVEDEE
jgi:hypothetical protein